MNKLNGYYIYYGTDSDGVDRKIDMQINEFEKYLSVKKLKLSRPDVKGIVKKLYQSIPVVAFNYNYDLVLSEIVDPHLVYIRRGIIDSGLIHFLKNLKERFPLCIVIMEFPVYPYYKEGLSRGFRNSMRMIPIYTKDLIYHGKLKKYVNYVSTFYEGSYIYGIPTLRIFNGINVDTIIPIKSPLDDTIDLFSVALMAKHHGFERVIKGLSDYYKSGGTRDVKLHLVGYGPEKPYYEKLVAQYGLNNRVLFYGRKVGSELDDIYEKADIAIASLAIYKLNLQVGSFIKTGEFLSKGLPIITGCPVDILDHSEFDYFLEFENNENPIDIDRIVQFYDDIYQKKPRKTVVEEIRKYAYKMVDMSVALKAVTDIIGRSNN